MPSTNKSRAKSGKATSSSHQLTLFPPHKGGQKAVYLHPARFQIVTCGRRWGKTELGKVLAIKRLLGASNQHVAWVSPTSKMSTEVWQEFMNGLQPIAEWVSVQEKTIILNNFSRMTFWTAENYDTLRGKAFDLVIADEAAMYKDGEKLWEAVLRPALSDREGSAYFLSTPAGRNWFYNLYQMGDKNSISYDVDYQSWNFPSNTSPYFKPKEFAAAERTLQEHFFRQEYLAQFMIDAGEVFKGVVDVSNSETQEPYEGHFVMGIDLGRKHDYTVISIMDVDRLQQVEMIRLKTMDFVLQKQEIIHAYERWMPNNILVEENNFGVALIDFLGDSNLPIESFITTNKSKREIIDQLALHIKNETVSLLKEPVQIAELQAYTMKIGDTGTIRYNAPNGAFDDTVMALALSLQAALNSTGTFGAGIPMIA